MAGNRWIRWDVGYFRNPKARALGKDGRALHLASSCWSADNLTDGHVPAHMLPMLCAEAEVRPATAKTLVSVGVWIVEEDGWTIHDFLEHNKSKAEVEAERDKWKRDKAGQRGVSTADTATESTKESRAETDVTRREVRSAEVSELTDDLLPGKPPSSSFSAEQTVAHQLARMQARDDPPKNIERWLPVTRKGILTERRDDIVRALLICRGDIERTVDALRPGAGAVVVEAWYADPHCECGGDGWQTLQDNTFAPCDCRRPEPYMATIHQLHEGIA